MVNVVPLTPAHLLAIRDRLQPAQAHLAGEIDGDGYARMLIDNGPAFAVLRDGAPVAAGGVMDDGRGKATAWSLLTPEAGPIMRTITRLVRGFFMAGQWRRAEIMVRADHIEGWRWARLLGFEFEGTLRKWGADGADYHVFSIIKEAAHG
jgi:hypothetical protein